MLGSGVVHGIFFFFNLAIEFPSMPLFFLSVMIIWGTRGILVNRYRSNLLFESC